MVSGGKPVNYGLATPLSVNGNALHIINCVICLLKLHPYTVGSQMLQTISSPFIVLMYRILKFLRRIA